MTTSSPELSEMADIFPSEGWTDSQQDQKVNQQASLRPHAQAHLLSSTENCKVGAQLAISLSSTATTVTSAVSNSSDKQKPDKLVPLTDSLISGLALLNPSTTELQYF